MVDHELRMCAYVQLACLSHQKRQALRRDQFFLLAGTAAYRAGWPDVGERCRELLLKSNPHHVAGQFANLGDALRNADFERLVTQHERHCPAERAELLLEELGIDPRGDQPELSRGERMQNLLAEIVIEPTMS
jgi:hypothetical protein